MFKPAKIDRLPKMNFRYRLLKVENEWYLMDVDRPIIITYFLPWFTYFIPHKGYQLTEDEVEAIAPKVLKRDKNILSTQTKAGISTLGAGSLAVLLGRAFPIEDYLYFTESSANDPCSNHCFWNSHLDQYWEKRVGHKVFQES